MICDKAKRRFAQGGAYKVGAEAPLPSIPRLESEIVADWSEDWSDPLVSVICHTYNHVEYIANALDGFLSQKTSFPFEVIVHDDASSDGTAAVVKSYATRYPRIIKSIAQTVNQYSQGIKPPAITFPLARGKYIALCEGDDYWLSESKLATQADFLEHHPDFSVCHHDAMVVSDGKIKKLSKLPSNCKSDSTKNKLSKGVFVLTLSAMFVNRVSDIPCETKYFVNGDNLLFSRLGQLGAAKYLGSMCPAVYRVHAGGVWSTVDDKKRPIDQANSLYWVSQYYSRTGNQKLATHFSARSMMQIALAAERHSFRLMVRINILFLKRVFSDILSAAVRVARR